MKVSWDDEIPNMMGKIKHVPNHQPVYIYIYRALMGYQWDINQDIHQNIHQLIKLMNIS